MSIIPDFDLDPEHRRTLTAQAVASGANESDATLMADLMVHAVNEAMLKAQEVCDRHPNPAYAMTAKINVMPWLSMWAASMTKALIAVAPSMGLNVCKDEDAQRIIDRFNKDD